MPRHGVIAIVVGATCLAGFGATSPVGVAPAQAATQSHAAEAATNTKVDPSSARQRTQLLQPGWRSSSDRLWTVRGDAAGLHLLVADAADAYTWRTVTTLSEPGADTDRWVGNACLSTSGRYAVVVYAPRSFTNDESLYLRGAYVATVDLTTGAVRKLPIAGSLSYFDPGCGAGNDAVVTAAQFPDQAGRRMQTRLYRVNAATGATAAPLTLRGQYSAAVPTATGIVATRGSSIVRIAKSGATTTLVQNSGGAFDLATDTAGNVDYLAGTEATNRAMRIRPSGQSQKPDVLATSKGSWMGLRRGTNGRVFVLKQAAPARDLGGGAALVAGTANDEISTEGAALIVHGHTPSPKKDTAAWRRAETLTTNTDGSAGPLHLQARIRATGRTVAFTLVPGLRLARRGISGSAPATAGPAAEPMAKAASVTGTSDSAATCAVPRNDPATQVYQPTPRQVEWAADQAVVGNLLTARPANWKQSGLASWTPQKMFPNPTLHGGGRVPVQVLLGILAQESNLWQASGHALSGEFGNPLVGDYYGRGNTWNIDYADADCGYGIGQVTDGMRKGAMAANQQRAIALDYETNIARSLQILVEKWNQTYDAGLIHDDGDPSSLENWIYAIWAYNTGFYPNKGDGSPWGVGWFNNPANPIYPANRGFFDADPADAAHPVDWPYEEKVIGWAAFSIATPDGPGFRTEWWVSDADRLQAKPGIYTFCNSSNNCTPGASNPCPAVDSTCWFHQPVTYHDCAHGYCGHELLRFNTTYPEQPDGTNYPPVCTLAGLPSGSWVVDDVPASVVAPRAGCGHPWTEKGAFHLTFASPSGRIDFHQIGGGFGGHFWFAHTRTSTEDGGAMAVTGKWTFNTSLSKWGRVFVHMPDHGAETQQAAYVINRGNGTKETRYALQRVQRNGWVSLGVLKFSGVPSISLSSQTFDGSGSDDIAFDAVAIKPLAAKPKDFVVAMGDSYSSGEGANDSTDGDDYYKETDFGGEYGANDPRRNACHRSPYAWSRKAVLADNSASIGSRDSSLDPTMDFHLIACSGAESENLLPYHAVPAGQSHPTNDFGQTGVGQYGELSQIDKGYLDANTTLVMFSIGGNDAFFGPVISDCANPIDIGADCLKADSTGYGENDTAIPDLIRGKVKNSVLDVLAQIHKYAPNAKILLMGYPELISDSGGCANIGAINADEAGWIDDMSLVMDNALAEDVATEQQAGMHIEIGAPIGDFSGKGACGDPEDINGIVLNRTAGDPPFSTGAPASQQSFHPKIAGTTLYANAANRALRLLGQ